MFDLNEAEKETRISSILLTVFEILTMGSFFDYTIFSASSPQQSAKKVYIKPKHVQAQDTMLQKKKWIHDFLNRINRK